MDRARLSKRIGAPRLFNLYETKEQPFLERTTLSSGYSISSFRFASQGPPTVSLETKAVST